MSRYQPYPEYKDSGVEWIGEVPAHWGVVPLRRIGILKGGSGFPIEAQGESSGGLGFYKVGDLSRSKDGIHLSNAEHYISKEKADSIGARILSKGSLCWAKIGAAASLNKRRIAPQDCCIDNNMTGFTTDPEMATPRFMLFLMSQVDFNPLMRPGAVPSLSEGEQSRILIGIPSVQEQTQIATFLDRETTRIDTLIEKKQRFIELLEEKRQAVITQAVTKGLDPDVPMKDSGVEWIGEVPAHWEVVKCFHAGVVIHTGKVDVNIQSPNGYYPFFTCGRETKYADQYSFDCEAILVAGNGEVGYTHYYQGKFEAYQRVYVLTSLAEFNPQFLVYYFKANLMGALESKAVGSVIQFITLGDLRHFPIAHPDVHAQSKIATFLDRETTRIDTLVAKTRESIDLLKERRSALITAAVTGKIDVRGEAA